MLEPLAKNKNKNNKTFPKNSVCVRLKGSLKTTINATEDMSYQYKDSTTDKLLNDHCYGKI